MTECSSRGLLGRPQRSYLFAMSSMPPAYLRAELVTPSKSEAVEMPTLRGFDEEFGQAAGVTQLDRTRSIFAVALGAAILGGLTLVWLAVDGGRAPEGSVGGANLATKHGATESRELVDRLLSQVEALKSEVRELTEAQQQLAQANAAIEAEQESATERRPYTGTQTPLRCRPGSRADLSRGASCRFRDGQRAHVDNQPCIVEIALRWRAASAISPTFGGSLLSPWIEYCMAAASSPLAPPNCSSSMLPNFGRGVSHPSACRALPD